MSQQKLGDVPPVLPTKKPVNALWKVVGIAGLVMVCAGACVFGIVLRMVHSRAGDGTASSGGSLSEAVEDISQIATNPRDGFPDKSRIILCCMGIDDNWTDQNIVFTTGARTDTLFLAGLDLENKKAAMLSIPRDAYVPIAGTDYKSKINSAYATGGPARTVATVAKMTGVYPDHYIVLNIDATKRMVDALGGVDVNVEHQMNYDDNWGHLHVHLMPGFQHLDGDEAVGFARYRHGNHGLSPEDGDPRRIYRQHLLLRAMVDKAKTFSSVLNANKLVDTAMSCIRTDMTRTQIFDLAMIFHTVNQDDIQTAQLIGDDGREPNGAYIMLVDQDKARRYVDWLMKGDARAGRAVTTVLVENGTKMPGLAAKAVEALKSAGFEQAQVAGNATDSGSESTRILDTGVDNRAGGKEVSAVLGVPQATITRKANEPNKMGWSAPAALTIVLGKDYVAQAKTASAGNSVAAPANRKLLAGQTQV